MSEPTPPAAAPNPAAPAAEPDAPESAWRRFFYQWGLPLLAFVLLFQLAGYLRAPRLPEAAPDFALRDLQGQTVQLADFRGKTVVLNFWATWCAPCRVEIPSFSAFAQRHPEVPVLGLVADGPAGKVRVASRDYGVTYPVLMADRATLEAYGITTFPTTVIVGPEGEVRAAHTGIMFRPQLAWAVFRRPW